MAFLEMKAIIGAILVAADEPVKLDTLAKGMRVSEIELEDALFEYEADLRATKQGVQVRHRDGTVRLEVTPDYIDVVGRVLPKWSSKDLSDAAQFTLAYIAWKQPVTLSDINAQRSDTDSSAAVQTLCNRGLVARAAKLGPRRQKLWCTTPHFLAVHRLKSIEEFREKLIKERIFPTLFNDDDEEEGGEELEAELGGGQIAVALEDSESKEQ
jgi:segregation and condensation protein B